MTQPTQAQRLSALELAIARIEAAIVPAPAVAAPVVGTAEAPLYERAPRARCARPGGHAGCTRFFKSIDAVGFSNHVACTGKACDNGKHRHSA
jgi:hypothetical protein